MQFQDNQLNLHNLVGNTTRDIQSEHGKHFEQELRIYYK